MAGRYYGRHGRDPGAAQRKSEGTTVFKIVKRRELNPTVTELVIEAPLIAKKAQAGQFIKGLCGYAFDGVPMETKDAKIASAYAYAKTALDVSVKSRENGRKGGLLVAERMRGAKASPVKPSAAESDPMGMLLKGIVLSVAEDAAESKGKK